MEEEYLGLSLSLSSSGNGCHTHLSLLPSSSCHLLFPYSGIDVNEAPSTAAAGRSSEEDGGASSSAGGKRTDQHDASSRGVSDEDDDGDGCRKKLRLTKDQSAVLEESFKEHSTLSPKQKLALAKQLKLRPRQVEVWFQNRRARTKLKQTEVDCELLRRCCQDLTEENRRLQKEVQELRSLKLSPQFYMHLTPPTTLTLCPSCERVATSASLTSSSKNQPPPEHHHQRPIAAPFPLRLPFLDAPPPRT